MSELQSASAGTHAGHTDPLIVGRGYTGDGRTAETSPSVVRDGEAARVSVEVCDGYEQRIRQLEEEVKILKSVIMALNLTELAAGFHKISTDFKKAERLIQA